MTSKPDDPFAWMMAQSVYEPAPTLEPPPARPMPLFWRLFWVVVVLAVIGCGLAGLAN